MLLTKTVIKNIEKNPKLFVSTLDVKKLKAILQEANDAYHNTGSALITDLAYDILEEEYKNRTDAIQGVGAPVHVSDARKKRLPFWMGSMDKIKDTESDALSKWLDKHPTSFYIVTDKLDGNSALLHFKDGMISLYSRGDGVTGQDISHLIPMLKTSIPTNMSKKAEFAIRGELIINKTSFKQIDKQFANARNAVAGLINSKNTNADIAKLTEFVAYELILPNGKTLEEQLIDMDGLGIPVVYAKKLKVLSVDKLSHILAKRKSDSDYQVDGIVVQHNKVYQRKDGRNPSYAFAFKSMATLPTAIIKVLRVEWALSKDGLLKPVVHFTGIQLSGVTISRATGHNAEFIYDHKIGPGAQIEIVRSGDVIPYISKVVKGAKTPQMPDVPYAWNATEKEILLKRDEANSDALDELAAKQIENFLSKLGAKGIAAGNVKVLFNNGFNTIKKVVNIQFKDLIGLPGIKEAKAKTIVNGIQTAIQNMDCVALMEASNTFGIGFGSRKLQTILDGLSSENVHKLMIGKYKPTSTVLASIEGVGKTTAENFLMGLDRFVEFVKDTQLKCAIMPANMANPKFVTYVKENFGGKTVVFTGIRNAELEALIKATGGKVTTSVSKNTNVLIANEKRSKYLSVVKINEEAGYEKIKIIEWSSIADDMSTL